MSSSTYVNQEKYGTPIDISKYRCMINSSLYLTPSYPEIMFSACLCACYKLFPKESHLSYVNIIMSYLKGTKNVYLWYPKGGVCDLVCCP